MNSYHDLFPSNDKGTVQYVIGMYKKRLYIWESWQHAITFYITGGQTISEASYISSVSQNITKTTTDGGRN